MKVKKGMALLSLLAVTACGGSKDETVSSNNPVNESYREHFVTEKPEEISIFAIHNGVAFDNKWPVFEKAAEMTNITMRGVASKNQTDEGQAYNLLLASGNLPDVISYVNLNDLEKLGKDGGLVGLNDLIDEYGPNIKKFFKENPRYKKDAVAADGNIYAIPNYYDYFNMMPSTAYFIRQDWLDNLGLDTPQNTDELYEVLKAFKERDPNENGKNDEVPMYLRKDTVELTLEALTDVFNARSMWYADNDGTMKFGPSEKDYKDAMRNLEKWYSEGLIDAEVFTRGLSGRDYMLSNNLGGFSNDWIGSTSSYNYNTSIKNNIPGFNFEPLLPPSHNGLSKTYQSRTTYLGGWGVTTAAKDPEKVVKYFDFWFSDEGRRLWNFGVEGREWDFSDGNPVFTDFVMDNPDGKTPLAVLRGVGAQYRIGVAQDANYEKQWYTDLANKTVDMYMEAEAVEAVLPDLKYHPEELNRFLRVNTQLQTLVTEMSQKWIMGASDVDKDWDNYVKRLNEIGLGEAMGIQQETYTRFMKN